MKKILIALMLTVMVFSSTACGSEPAEEPTEEPTTSAEEHLQDQNKSSAWAAVDTYCRTTKEWKATDFHKDRVEVDGDSYSVYVKRKMVDGTEGTFLYVLTPADTRDDGYILTWHVDDQSQVE